MVSLIVHNRFVKPRRETNVGSTCCRAPIFVGALHTSPIVFGCVDTARAHGGLVKRTNVSNSDLVSKQIVQMDVDLRRVLTAMSTSSSRITFCEMTVPSTGEPPLPLLMLIPTLPGVAVSAVSARFPAM